MSTRPLLWRTAPSGTEGTTVVYVDSRFGSDTHGDGTRAKPYQTITKAYNAKSTKPSTIVCRGTFRERLSQGNHSCVIRGDYLGAATINGGGGFLLYGYGHRDIIIREIPPALGTEPVNSGSHLLAGVGRAFNASFVGNAVNVYGVAGSSVCMHDSALYMGCIGGSTAVANCLYDSPVHNSSYFLALGGQQNATFLTNCTVYNVAVDDRVKCQYGNTVEGTLFGKFAFIGNELRKVTFVGCVFAADCKWYWFSGNNATAGYEEIVLEGETSAERRASLLAQLTERGLSSSLMPAFTNCIFSGQTSEEIFNDAEHDDFTLVPGCDADWYRSSNTYCGAFPPAKRIRVMDDSTGVPETWDERSVSGCLMVEDNTLKVDTDSVSLTGEIYSKILQIDPVTTQYNYLANEFESKFDGLRAYLNKEAATGVRYEAGETLPVGLYIVYGPSVVHGETVVADGHTLLVEEEGTTFASEGGAVLLEVVEPNMSDVVYCRCRQAVYARVTPSDLLQRGATYLNDGEETVVYHHRDIAPGESFVCMIEGEQFADPNHAGEVPYSLAVMFDDSRVPSSEWIPAQQLGEYFVSKSGGAIEADEFGVPYSSGNYKSFAGGHVLLKSVLDRRFVQFAIKVTRYGTGVVD